MRSRFIRLGLGLALLLAVPMWIACSDSEGPTNPNEPPEWEYHRTGVRVINIADGSPVYGALVTIATGVDSDSFVSDDRGVTPPKELGYDPNRLGARPWELKVWARSPSDCGGPVGPTAPCIKEVNSVPVLFDWQVDPRYGSYLGGSVFVEVL